MRLLLVVDDLDRARYHGALPDPEGLRAHDVSTTVATRRRATADESQPPFTTRIVPGVSLRDTRNLAHTVALASRALLRPRRAARLARHQRQRSSRTTAIGDLLRNLPLADVEADVVHFETVGLSRRYELVASGSDAPIVLTCWGPELASAEHASPRARLRLARELRAAAAVHCPTESIAAGVRRISGRDDGVWVVPPGIEPLLDDEERTADSGGAVRILAAAPLTLESGLDHLIGALARLRDDGVPYRAEIVGEGPLRSRLQWAIDDLQLDGRIQLSTPAPGDRVPDRLRAADVFVSTGRGSSPDPMILQAMAAGLPVVASSVGGDELVRDTIDGRVVDRSDVARLAQTIGALIQVPAERERMGRSARQRVEQEFSLRTQASAFAAMYQSVLHEKRSSVRRAVVGPVGGPRVGWYTRTFPKKPDMVRLALALIEAGVDLHIFAGEPSAYADRFPDLPAQILADRVSFLSRRRRSPWAHVRSRPDALRRALRHPRDVARLIRHHRVLRGGGPLTVGGATWSRLPFVGMPLEVLHVESDTWALDVADLKDYLGCRMLLTSVTTLQRTPVADAGPAAYKQIFEAADGYHFISDYVRRNTEALGLPPMPTWVVHLGVDCDLLTPPPERSRSAAEPLRVLSVGRLFWEKGYEWGLEAIAEVRAAGVPVVYTIIGAGPARDSLRNAASELGLFDVVRFAGDLPTDAVISEYGSSDVLLHPALEDAFPMVIAEAQAMALPVVATDAGGVPEMIEDGVTGFVVARRDATALAEKLAVLGRDPALARKMGRAGRERVEERFDVRRQAERVAQMYAELASFEGGGRG